MLYQTVWKPSVEYPLAQSFLSEKQLRKIEQSSMPKLIAKCGYNRNTSRAVLAGPIELGGGGFTPLYTTSGSGYVLHFLKNWRTPAEDIGKQLRITYAWSAFQAGVSFPLLEHPHKEVNYVKGKVIPATRKYLAAIEGTIVLDTKYIRPKLHEHDECIMDKAISMDFTPTQLERINCVRMFIGVMYTSEICTIDGASLRPGILNGNHNTHEYVITLSTPKQSKPNRRSWDLWAKLVTEFTSDGTRLKQQLGRWTSDHSKSGRWSAYRLRNKVYKYTSIDNNNHEYWEVYEQHGTHLQLQDEIDVTEFNPNVTSSIPVYIDLLDNGKQYSSHSQAEIILPVPAAKRTHGPMVKWDSFLLSQPKWIKVLLEDVEFYTTDDGEPDFYSLQSAHAEHGQLLCVSDGSVISHDMSFGWILATPKGTRLVGSKGPCNGRGNSLRAEGAGMLSGTLFLSILSDYLNQIFNIVFISDNA